MPNDEATFQRNWKVTVGICLAYSALLIAFVFLVVLTIAEPRSTTQVRRVGPNQPSVTGPSQLAVDRKVK